MNTKSELYYLVAIVDVHHQLIKEQTVVIILTLSFTYFQRYRVRATAPHVMG
jgi:hypothetical protein